MARIKRMRQVGTLKNFTDDSPEVVKLNSNREFRFREILGKEWPDSSVETLVRSKVDYWELDKLVKDGCDPEIAISILI